jgi:hypothetical protein
MSWLFDFWLGGLHHAMWYLTTRRVQLVSFQPTTRRYFVELLVRNLLEGPFAGQRARLHKVMCIGGRGSHADALIATMVSSYADGAVANGVLAGLVRSQIHGNGPAGGRPRNVTFRGTWSGLRPWQDVAGRAWAGRLELSRSRLPHGGADGAGQYLPPAGPLAVAGASTSSSSESTRRTQWRGRPRGPWCSYTDSDLARV